MRVKMRTTYAGPHGTCSAGGTLDLPPPVAYDLIERGYASQVGAPERGAVIETAILPAHETAALHAGADTAQIPDDWRTFNADDTKALAASLGAGDDVRTKAQAVEFIDAELAKRGQA